MVLARRWPRCRLPARDQGCRGSARDHGRPAIGQAKPYGSRVHRDRSAVAASAALGRSRTPAITRDVQAGPPMTTEAVSAAILPPRFVWRGLLWPLLFTVAWGWLIYQMPALVESGFPTIAARLMSYGLVALGLWLGLEAADLTPR